MSLTSWMTSAYDGVIRVRVRGTPLTYREHALWVAGAALAAALVAGLTAAVVKLAFITDDMDMLREVALLRSGDVGWWYYLTHHHNEHRVPMLRALYWMVTLGGDFNAVPLRVSILCVHAACAGLLARLAMSMLRPIAAITVGVMFAGAIAFAAMPLWAPSTVVFSLSCAFFLLACERLQNGGSRRTGTATAALLAAGVSLNAAALVIPLVIASYWSVLGDTTRKRVAWATLWLSIGLAVLWWSAGGVGQSVAGVPVQWESALRNAAFLVVSAPYRWIRAWTTGSSGPLPSWTMVAPVCVGWIAIYRAVPTNVRPTACMLTLAASVLAGAVGYGRYDFTLEMLYSTDRYYYWFAAPFALVTISIATRVLGEQHAAIWRSALLLMLVAASAGMQAHRTLPPIVQAPWIVLSGRGIDSARFLGQLLTRAASAGPLEIHDGFVPIPGLHKGGITLKTVSFSMSSHGIPNVRFVASARAGADTTLNRVLTEWATRQGWAESPVVAQGDDLVLRTAGRLRFAQGPFTQQVVSGFHAWEGHARWMSRRGTVFVRHRGERVLHVVAAAPARALREALGPEARFAVTVRADGVVVGSLNMENQTNVDASFPLPDTSAATVTVDLESAFVWHARQIYPGNADPRELSIYVSTIELLP